MCGFNSASARAARATRTLRSIAANIQHRCDSHRSVTADGEAISSTRIRKLLASGDTEEAAKLPRQTVFHDFPVEQGKHLGRTIGLPTINQFSRGLSHSRARHYAVTCEIGQTHSAPNIGRPTVSDSANNCRPHTATAAPLRQAHPRSFYRRYVTSANLLVQGAEEQIERDIFHDLRIFPKIMPPRSLVRRFL